MDLRERFNHISEHLTTSIPQRKLGDFLSSLPTQNPGRTINKKEIGARIHTLPFEANNLFMRNYGNDIYYLLGPLSDDYGNTWQIHSSNPFRMKVSVENGKGILVVTSSYAYVSSEEIKADDAILWNPDRSKILVEFANQGNFITITKPLR